MNEKLENNLDELIDILEKDERITELSNLKEKLFNNNSFLEKINKLKYLDIYSNEYKNLKKELFSNEDFIKYKQLENEINILIMQINQKLKTLTDERGCNHENN